MNQKVGRQTIVFNNPAVIVSTSSICGPKEGEGPLGKYFDIIIDEETYGEKSWEKAEIKMVIESVVKALEKSGKSINVFDYAIAGDLLNQNIAANFAFRDFNVPFLGIYGACSTIGEALGFGSMLVSAEYATNIICTSSSHFCSAERQFRFPLELGSQRCPSAQWTVTGAGTLILSNSGNGPKITAVTTGKIMDMGFKDANNMGAAMAPAAADTIKAHLSETNRSPDYYDLIVTGDLGSIGSTICCDLLERENLSIRGRHNDCGLLMYNIKGQDAHAGGSGCGCAACVFAGYLFEQMKMNLLNKVLLIPTGALLSTTSMQQSESIPSIAHAVAIENI